MKSNTILATVLMAIFLLIFYINADVRYINFKCTVLDKEFCAFEYCFLKSVNRSYKYLSLKAKLFQTPINNISVRMALLKRANGYKPFLYDVTIDACKYLKHRSSNMVFQYFHEWFSEFSNMNHTCPFDHDLIVEKLDSLYLNKKMTEVLPMPRGQYCFESDWIAYGIKRANVRLYLDLT